MKKNAVCPECEKQFSNSTFLTIHINNIHKGIKFKCEKCNMEFTQESNKKRHVKVVHDKIKNFSCSLCDHKATSRSELLHHLNYKHLGKKYACHQCDKEFNYERYVSSHIRRVHDSQKFSCSNCDFQSTTLLRLKQHEKSVHINVFNCDICPETFTINEYLLNHKRRRHIGIPKRKCLECGKQYSDSSKLNRHMNAIHRGLIYKCKPYPLTQRICMVVIASECNYKKIKARHFRIHERKFHSGKPKQQHPCNLCEYIIHKNPFECTC